ncbi:MAG: hypothetical protein ACQBVK_03615, partial [Candidatus Phytoplasma sp. TWB_XP]
MNLNFFLTYVAFSCICIFILCKFSIIVSNMTKIGYYQLEGDKIQQLKTKEQGFRSEIDNLKLENQNLKEKYNHDLIKIQQELNTS